MQLAPIGISTYGRLGHLKQTIEALQKNTLAKESELYVFSDAPKTGDEAKVQAVRDYIKTIDGFKSVCIKERKENNRVENNRGNTRKLLDQYGKVIFLEEDIVTSPGFLRYMNEALEFYKDDERIASICGYAMPVPIPNDYPYDLYILPRFGGWGDGYWSDRFFMDTIGRDEYNDFISDRKAIKQFKARCGTDVLPLIKEDAMGNLDAGDVKFTYWQFKYGMYTVFPSDKSLSRNIGCDSSGEHCGETMRYDVELSDKLSFSFIKNIKEDDRIVQANAAFFSLSVVQRVFSKLKRILGRAM